MDEERLRILRLLEEGRINAQEAADLLAALESGQEREERLGLGGERAPRLHIRITDTETGRVKTDVVIPMGLLGRKWGKRIAGILAGRGMEGLAKATKGFQSAPGGARKGTIVDVTDDKRGERVEIVIE